jgi:7-cyano-7-deazaguanine synthase
MTEKINKAVVLSSGGLDSTTAMAIALAEGFECYSLSFSYGQRHEFELTAAKKIAKKFDVKQHLVLNIDLGQIGGSSLTDDMDVPKNRSAEEMRQGIPTTYVPARNTIFLSCALAWTDVLGASDIFIGVNAVDYSGYPDCRPEYIAAFEKMANLALKSTVEKKTSIHIRTPLLHMSKAEIIQTGIELGIDYSITHSCYDPDANGRACGMCDSCLLRKKGFHDARVPDPTKYITL